MATAKQDFLVVTGVPYVFIYQYGYTASYTLLLGNGAGGYDLQPAVKIADGIYAYQMITGDFNGDGKADFASFYAGTDFSHYNNPFAARQIGFNNGSGGFNYTGQISAEGYQANFSFGGFTVGDFDGDGRADLVIGPFRAYGPYLMFYGNSDLTILSSKSGAVTFDLASSPSGSLIIGDFDGDSKTDLIINAGGLRFYSGNGDGNLMASGYYNVSTNAAFAADLNGDGRLDLIGNGSVLLNSAAPVVDLRGSLTLEGIAPNAPPQLVHFTLRDGSGKTVLARAALVGTDGAFTLYGIPAGDYTVHVKGDKYLAANVPLHTPANSYPSLTAALRAGDGNNDNSVDSTDFGLLIGAYGSDASLPGTGYDARADFNSDGSVDSSDFGLLIGNFNTVGDN